MRQERIASSSASSALGHAPGCVQPVVGGQVWVVIVGEDPAELSPAAQVLGKLVVPTPGKPFGLA